jgi:hypothetical protein
MNPYPRLPLVASLPEEPQRIAEYLANNPGSTVVQMQPIEYDDGRTEFFPIILSN